VLILTSLFAGLNMAPFVKIDVGKYTHLSAYHKRVLEFPSVKAAQARIAPPKA